MVLVSYNSGEPLIDELRNCISNTNKDTALLCIFNSWSHEPGQLQHGTFIKDDDHQCFAMQS